MKLNTRHLAILMAGSMGVANIITSGTEQVTIAAIGVLSAAFVWDKLQSAVRRE